MFSRTCVVDYTIDFHVPNSDGGQTEEYRPMANEIFMSYMNALAAEL